jgi:hypothetical protein
VRISCSYFQLRQRHERHSRGTSGRIDCARDPISLQRGLIGIIGGSEIWATHTQYLNDHSEYVHALDLVRGEIKRRFESADEWSIKPALDRMLAAVSEHVQSINVCVCSFSEDGDSLSQWRAYGEAMSGFSIDFRGEFLARLAASRSFFLARCVYKDEDKHILVANFVNKVLAEIVAHQESTSDENYWQRGGNLVAYLHRVAPVLKDYAFRSEKEWRIISRPLMCSSEQFAYRPGRSMITPYYKLPLGNNLGDVGTPRIREVVVGPTPNSELSKQSTRSLLASVHLQSNFTPGGPVHVRESTVPYRAW